MQIPQWLEINKLSLNVKSANFIVFMNKNVSKPDICLRLMDMILNKLFKPNSLRIVIDFQLTWIYHRNYKSEKMQMAYS